VGLPEGSPPRFFHRGLSPAVKEPVPPQTPGSTFNGAMALSVWVLSPRGAVAPGGVVVAIRPSEGLFLVPQRRGYLVGSPRGSFGGSGGSGPSKGRRRYFGLNGEGGFGRWNPAPAGAGLTHRCDPAREAIFRRRCRGLKQRRFFGAAPLQRHPAVAMRTSPESGWAGEARKPPPVQLQRPNFPSVGDRTRCCCISMG